MGAETSTLASIESLSASLGDIERKLAVLEDAHLHHERTICHDNTVIISGKRIQCRSAVNLTLGPIIGLVGQTFGRIMVETDTDAEISIFIFLVDEMNTEARYQSEEKFHVRANAPTAKTFKGLYPGTSYAIYLGGINSSDTLLNYATFRTLPADKADVRILFTHKGRIDRLIPGELNLWNALESQIIENGVHAGNITGVDRAISEISEELLQGEHPSKSCGSSFNPIHIVVHNGDLISIDVELRRIAMQLLDSITREDSSIDSWELLLIDLEESIRGVYRTAYGSPTLRTVLRRCSNIFIAGQGESGMATTSFLAMGPIDRPTSLVEESILEPTKIEKKKKKAEDNVTDSEVVDVKVLKKKRGEEIEPPPEDTIADLEVPSMGGEIRRKKEAIAIKKDERTQTLEDLRLLVISAILRIARRVSWSYMRQLWDENYENMVLEDLQGEVLHRQILKARKELLVKKTIFGYLDRSRKKLTREFGEEYDASDRITARCKELSIDVYEQELEVREIIKRKAKFHSVTFEKPNGACLDLGNVVIVVIEPAWGWLAADGQVQASLFHREVSLHSDIIVELENCLGVASINPDEMDAGDTKQNEAKKITEKRCLVIAAPSLLISTGAIEPTIVASEPQMFSVATLDRRVLLRIAAKWQQQEMDRVSFFVGVSSLFSAEGSIIPKAIAAMLNSIKNGEIDDDKPPVEDDPEGWHDTRSRVHQIITGQMDRKGKARTTSRLERFQGSAPPAGFVEDNTGFVSEYNPNTTCSRRCYWDITIKPSTPPTRSEKSATGWISGFPAKIITKSVSDWRRRMSITIGPVIGKVTTTSACVLLETSEDGHLELLCIDQIMGIEYACSCLMRANRPSVFAFDNLIPDRPYDIVLSGPTILDNRGIKVGLSEKILSTQPIIRGSFCTHKITNWTPEDESDRKIATSLRDQVHNANNANSAPDWNRLLNGNSSQTLANQLEKRLSFLVVGSSKPSWLNILSGQSEEDVDASAYGNDREHISDGISLTRELVGLTSQAWSGIDIMIHCGYSADLVSTLDSVISLLVRAEEIAIRSVHTGGGGDYNQVRSKALNYDVDSLLGQAEENLRNAYRMHWGSSSTRSLLSHCSHLFVSSPMLDLLTAFNAPTLRQLSRDMSQYASEHMLRMITILDNEYQKSLWETRSIMNDRAQVQLLEGGRTALFVFRPKILFQQENFGTSPDNLIPEDQILALASLLQPHGDGELIQNLVIISPIPFVTEDIIFTDASFLSTAQKGMTYTSSEVLRILDLISEWVECFEQRDVILICGGVSVGRWTNIYVEHQQGYQNEQIMNHLGSALDNPSYVSNNIPTNGKVSPLPSPMPHNNNGGFNNSRIDNNNNGGIMTRVDIRQVCLGSLIGVEDDENLKSTGVLYSPYRTFKYEHCKYMHDPHSALITIVNEAPKVVPKKDDLNANNYIFQQKNIIASVLKLDGKKEFLSVIDENEEKSYVPSNRINLNAIKLWDTIKVYIQTGSKSKEKSIEYSSDADARDLLSAIRSVFSDNKELIACCHKMFKEKSSFGIPLFGGIAVEDAMMTSANWIITRLPIQSQAICAIPSSFSIRQIWCKFNDSYAETEDMKSVHSKILKSEASKIPSLKTREIVTANLFTDDEYFGRFIRQAIEAQVLLEHFSDQFGYNDGF